MDAQIVCVCVCESGAATFAAPWPDHSNLSNKLRIFMREWEATRIKSGYKKSANKKTPYRKDTLARIEWNWMNALVGLLLNTHVYHILRTCDVRHLLNGPSLISNRQYSMNNLLHVRCGSRAQIATGQWPAHHSTVSTASILHVQIPHVRATGPKITRTNTHAWGIFRIGTDTEENVCSS